MAEYIVVIDDNFDMALNFFANKESMLPKELLDRIVITGLQPYLANITKAKEDYLLDKYRSAKKETQDQILEILESENKSLGVK